MWAMKERFSIGGENCVQGEPMGIRNLFIHRQGYGVLCPALGIMANSIAYGT